MGCPLLNLKYLVPHRRQRFKTRDKFAIIRTMSDFLCHHCRKPVISAQSAPPNYRPARKETCPSCSSDVHVCLNCEFYDPTAYHECRESQAEFVKNKDTSNFCDYFRFSTGGSAASDAKNQTIAALDALFKK